jgi:SAM-dependent methyltransferase
MTNRPSVPFLVSATPETFDESAYLEANPDVADAVREGRIRSGRDHFFDAGLGETRQLSFGGAVRAAKADKLRRILADGVLANGLQLQAHPSGALDYLAHEIAEAAGIVHTDSVSSNDYDGRVQAIIDDHPDAWILDAGAGLRRTYHPNVVNYEVVPYATTDVLGIVERMPFADEAFDFVLSNAVLEHVRDPFAAAQEMSRVLKPGGLLFCAVPFLQPYHAYPHHYFNMTQAGLRSLFEDRLEIVEHGVPPYFHPAWTVRWILNAWAAGLSPSARESFRTASVGDLMDFTTDDVGRNYVVELGPDKQFELASGTFLIARKAEGAGRVRPPRRCHSAQPDSCRRRPTIA